MKQLHAHEGITNPCPTCGAQPGHECRSRTGQTANPPHRTRSENPHPTEGPQACPECGTPRRTPETLRAHRAIAHPLSDPTGTKNEWTQ